VDIMFAISDNIV